MIEVVWASVRSFVGRHSRDRKGAAVLETVILIVLAVIVVAWLSNMLFTTKDGGGWLSTIVKNMKNILGNTEPK